MLLCTCSKGEMFMQKHRFLCLLAVAVLAFGQAASADTGKNVSRNSVGYDVAGTDSRYKNKSKYPSFAASPKSDYADAIMLLPAPPAENSKRFEIDKDVYRENMKKYRGTRVWEEAKNAAKIDGESVAEFFSSAMGIKMSRSTTPKLVYLIENSLGDFLEPGNNAKRYYKRKRPFVYFDDRTCSTPDEDLKHERDGSYPSGYSTYGWGVALILTEINPKRSNQILETGLRMGQNRVICGFHWQSDVDWGRTLASYIVAELHTLDNFNKALAEAKEEFAKVSGEQKKSRIRSR